MTPNRRFAGVMSNQMRIARSLFFAIALAGCVTELKGPPRGYPVELRGLGDSPAYPMKVAGFERGAILAYEPGMKHLSTAYDLRTPEAQIASTIYLVPLESSASPISAQLGREKAAIEQYHPGAVLLEEMEVEISKSGVTYKGLKAAYALDGEFMNRRQRLYSEVMLWIHKDRYVKFRSTAPMAQREMAVLKNRELLNAVNWAF